MKSPQRFGKFVAKQQLTNTFVSVLTKKGVVFKKVFENTFPETFSVRMVKESVGDGQPGQDQKRTRDELLRREGGTWFVSHMARNCWYTDLKNMLVVQKQQQQTLSPHQVCLWVRCVRLTPKNKANARYR